MDDKLIITFDPVADSVYVRLAEASLGTGETTVDDNGVIVDTDEQGKPRGFEFLDVSLMGIPFETLPREVVLALQRFIAAGYLESTSLVEMDVV